MPRLKKRHREILQALSDLGGTATTGAIAGKVNLHVNGVSQSLGALSAQEYVSNLGGYGGEVTWKLEKKL